MEWGEMRKRRCLSYLEAMAVGGQDYQLCTVILWNDFPREADGSAEGGYNCDNWVALIMARKAKCHMPVQSEITVMPIIKVPSLEG